MANKPFKKLRFSLTGDTYSPVDEQARQNIGDLSQLDTEHKDNLVEAINEAAQSGGGGTGVPSGGIKGQVLTKLSNIDGDAAWEYPPVMSASGNDPSNLTVTWNENYTVMDFFARQELVQADYQNGLIHLKLVKAYISTVAPDYTMLYHFEFGAITEISNGSATIATLEVVCDNASAHTGVGVYTEVNVGVSDEAVQDAVDEYLTEHPALTGMFTNAAKSSLIALLEKVAYIDGNGQQYLDELITNLAATVTSIDAVFTQGAVVIYDTDSLDTLEQYLVVTANYSDGTSSGVTGYTLSGALTVGTSTITVSYEDKTDTFTVTVTDYLSTITFEQGACARTGGSGQYSESIHEGTASARIRSVTPFINSGYVFTVTDSAKYNVVAYNITSPTTVLITESWYNGPAYPGVSNSKSWKTSDSSISAYVWLVLRKLDNTDFTEEEIGGAYGIVFTATKGA